MRAILESIVLVSTIVFLLMATQLWSLEIYSSTKAQPTPVSCPAITIEAQKIGNLYCPAGTIVYTDTIRVQNGYRVFCR